MPAWENHISRAGTPIRTCRRIQTLPQFRLREKSAVSASLHRILCVVSGLLLLLSGAGASGADSIRLVAIGDSLVAGYGLPVEDGFVAQLESALTQKSYDVSVFNAGVSGDTTSGGLSRIDWVLSENYSAVILNLGFNDAFRGIPVQNVQLNLDELILKIRQRNLPTLLAGALAPRNLGPDYSRAFDAIYPNLADKHELIFYPFFLEGVASVPDLNQEDGIHPNKDGVAVIVRQLLPYVEQLIARIPN